MEQEARITSKGQVTIPKAACKALGITEGEILLFEVSGRTLASLAESGARRDWSMRNFGRSYGFSVRNYRPVFTL